MRKSLVLLLLWASCVSADMPYDSGLCFILDGFLSLYGLFITGLFVREKFFRPKAPGNNHSSSQRALGADQGGQGRWFDPESGAKTTRSEDQTYTGLMYRGEDSEYRELPRKEQRQRKNEGLYEGLRSATRDTYDILQQR